MGNMLIKNAQIVTMNQAEEIITGDIYIEGNIIKEIGENLEKIT